MDPLIFDTSVWISHLNGKTSKQSVALENYLLKAGPVFICSPIIQEILQGIRNESQFNNLKDLLLSLNILELGEVRPYLLAASLFRSLRSKGVTIRKSADALIAIYAIEFGIALAHQDRDFDMIAKHTLLKVKKF
ncbi:MAG: PIN domain-containing protein [Chitinophagales bacterium]